MTSRERSLDEDFSGSDSDEEYDENERQLLSNFRNSGVQEYSDDENEVLGVGSDETDSDDNKSDLALSDVEGQDEDDDLPDIRAWGKDKKKFYKTDYVDADYGGFQGKDAHLAELEEEEARNIQKQLAQQLDDDDFGVELFAKKSEEDAKPGEEVVKTDLSKLSKRQKLQILEKESPEFFSLVEDFQGKIVIARDFLRPVLQKYKKGKIPNCEAVDFVQTQYELILNYCTNIYMYLLLKSTKASNIQNHPVIKRLFQYRQLLLQLEPVFEEIIKPQIELLLKEEELTNNNPEKKKKTLKLLSSLKNKTEKAKKNKKQVSIDEPPSKKMKVDENISVDKEAALKDMEPGNIADSSEDDAEKVDEEKPEETEETNEVGKRAITYKMSKNKGLTPHRKKEQRNPRVKHKLKYRKAVIQRKGAVREPRKELHRYSGEISGIKASVSRSIKIKT